MGQEHGKNYDLSPEDLVLLVRKTGYSKNEMRELYAKFLVDFPRGYIDKKKTFRAVYSIMYPQGSEADKFASHVYRVCDVDGDGRVSFSDFMMIQQVASKGSREAKLKAAFRMYDTNGDGSISQKELTKITTAIYKTKLYSHPEAKAKLDAEKIMHQLDTDANKKLSEAEFVQAARTCPKLLHILDGRPS